MESLKMNKFDFLQHDNEYFLLEKSTKSNAYKNKNSIHYFDFLDFHSKQNILNIENSYYWNKLSAKEQNNLYFEINNIDISFYLKNDKYINLNNEFSYFEKRVLKNELLLAKLVNNSYNNQDYLSLAEPSHKFIYSKQENKNDFLEENNSFIQNLAWHNDSYEYFEKSCKSPKLANILFKNAYKSTKPKIKNISHVDFLDDKNDSKIIENYDHNWLNKTFTFKQKRIFRKAEKRMKKIDEKFLPEIIFPKEDVQFFVPEIATEYVEFKNHETISELKMKKLNLDYDIAEIYQIISFYEIIYIDNNYQKHGFKKPINTSF